MELRDCVPSREIAEALGTPIKELVLTTEAEIIRHDHAVLADAGHMAWHQVRECDGIDNDHPFNQLVAKHIKGNLEDPRIVPIVQAIVEKKVIRDILLAEGTTGDGKDEVYRVSLANLFPGALFIDDVKFSDPRRPLKTGEHGLEDATHHGFGLLGEFLRRTELYAQSRNLCAIVLVASHRSQEVLFTKHGFRPDESEMCQLARINGMGMPMIREVGA